METDLEETNMSNLKSRIRQHRLLAPTLFIVALMTGIAVAQIFSNQLNYQIRVKDDNERYSITEMTASFNDLWGAGSFDVKVDIEKHYDPGTSRLNCEIVNLDGKNITTTDFSGQKAIWDGDGVVWLVIGDLSVGSGGGITQGVNASTVIVYVTCNFAMIDTPTGMQIRLVVSLLAGIASGDYGISLYIFSS